MDVNQLKVSNLLTARTNALHPPIFILRLTPVISALVRQKNGSGKAIREYNQVRTNKN